jgi:hypothetical protein
MVLPPFSMEMEKLFWENMELKIDLSASVMDRKSLNLKRWWNIKTFEVAILTP